MFRQKGRKASSASRPDQETVQRQQTVNARLSARDWRLYRRLQRNGKILGSRVFS